MNKKDMMQIKESLTMPSEMTEALTEGCTVSKEQPCHNRLMFSGTRTTRTRLVRSRRLTAAAAAVFCIFAVGSTSLAYNIYQEKQLAVFLAADLSQAEIDSIGLEIARICDISDCPSLSCTYVSGDEAWAEFKAAYLTDESGTEITELTSTFEENPLADSFNYRVSVRMNADTQAVRDRISQLPGVRKVTTVREAQRSH